MLKSLLAVLALVALSVTTAAAESAMSKALGLPEPPDAELSYKADMATPDLLKAVNTKLPGFVKELKEAKVFVYRLTKPAAPSDLLKIYEPELEKQSWRSVASENANGEMRAIFARNDRMLILSLVRHPEGLMLTFLSIAGTFDLSVVDNTTKPPSVDSGFAPPSIPTSPVPPPAATTSQAFQEVPMGEPRWENDAVKGTFTGARDYRPMLIPAKDPGKLIVEGFVDEPKVQTWDRPEIMISYKKIFTGTSQSRALDMERRCLLMVDNPAGEVQVRQALVETPGSPTTEVTCKTVLDISAPGAWKIEFRKK